MSDPIHSPGHYTWHPTGITQREISEHFPYNIGCAIKYLWRYQRKHKPLQDLLKAQQCIAFEIERLTRTREKHNEDQ